MIRVRMLGVLTSFTRKLVLLLPLAFVPPYLFADEKGDELFRTLAALDAALFDSYNECDLEKNRTFFADDLEFYHDKGGLTVGADKLK